MDQPRLQQGFGAPSCRTSQELAQCLVLGAGLFCRRRYRTAGLSRTRGYDLDNGAAVALELAASDPGISASALNEVGRRRATSFSVES